MQEAPVWGAAALGPPAVGGAPVVTGGDGHPCVPGPVCNLAEHRKEARRGGLP